ncbi:MAG: four helix bundle protein [Planctomycetes bacterium]|nr:four helix bundle protein [Planctomycetota bacterium]
MEKKEPKRLAAKKFEDLFVWQKAHKLVLSVYRATKEYPKEELYGLVSQMRRAAVSIAANIAEGFKKRTAAEKCRFLTIAHSSLEEVRYYMILSKDLNYYDTTKTKEQVEEVSKLLTLYRAKIKDS